MLLLVGIFQFISDSIALLDTFGEVPGDDCAAIFVLAFHSKRHQ